MVGCDGPTVNGFKVNYKIEVKLWCGCQCEPAQAYKEPFGWRLSENRVFAPAGDLCFKFTITDYFGYGLS